MKQRSQEVSTRGYWRQAVLKAVGITVVSAALLIAVFSFITPAQIAVTRSVQPTYQMVQDDPNAPQIAVLPEALERISWGAVLAGAIMAIAIQISVNLLAVRMGASSFNPRYDADPDLKDSVMTGAVWVGLGTLVAMFVGGWIAARFAGIPEGVDGMLHGLMVWAVVTLVSLLFLGSAVGRLLGGVSALVGQGLNLAGRVTETAARGAVDVAKGATGIAKDVVSGAANVVEDVASDAANTTKDAAGGLRAVIQKAVDSSPELSDALEQIDLARKSVESEARRMLRQAGVAPDQLSNKAKETAAEARRALTNNELAPADLKAATNEIVDDVKQTAKQVTQQVQEDPEEAFETLNLALRRVLRKGQIAVNDVDRNAVVEMLVKRGNMDETQARETLAQWEDRFNQAKTEAERVREAVQQRVEQLQSEAEMKARQLEGELREKAEDARREAERVAREAAQKTSDAIAQIAGLVFAAIIVGAVAAGIGGWIGTPERLPTVNANDQGASTDTQLHLTSASLTFPDFE